MNVSIRNSVKNLLRVATIVGVLFTVACTKDASSVTDTFASSTITPVDELVVSGTAAGGADSLKGDTTGRGHCWKGGGGGGKHGGQHPNNIVGDTILFSALPAATQTYLTANKDITTITRIVKVTLPDGTVNYVVRFSDTTHLHFDAAGALLATPTDRHKLGEIIKLADLPAAAQTYLNANVTVADINTIIKITKPDGTIVYGVRMSDGTHYAFDAAGALLPAPVGDKGRGKGKH